MRTKSSHIAVLEQRIAEMEARVAFLEGEIRAILAGYDSPEIVKDIARAALEGKK